MNVIRPAHPRHVGLSSPLSDTFKISTKTGRALKHMLHRSLALLLFKINILDFRYVVKFWQVFPPNMTFPSYEHKKSRERKTRKLNVNWKSINVILVVCETFQLSFIFHISIVSAQEKQTSVLITVSTFRGWIEFSPKKKFTLFEKVWNLMTLFN